MTEHDDDKTGLEAYFEAARKQSPAPSDALMARVLDDARAAQEQGAAAAAAQPRRARGRLTWARALAAIGGWPAGASLAAATLAGVWLGAYPPAALGTFGAEVLGGGKQAYVVDLMPDFALDEGLVDEEGLNDV
ncbi:hypothetical protein [Sediminimonas qiaohouensis]|uniref:hypothetical protein n=1 Tax=Sediminimonas qiaohouensis TaxID=552061 RepID=UPI00040048F5|nr:hypothetical protein [Sediminimonas qiaohouensis]